jgi:uncharacterized protein YhfF
VDVARRGASGRTAVVFYGFAMTKTAVTDAFFAAFRADTQHQSTTYDICAFGNTESMMDDLAALVLHGPKRATAGLYHWYAIGEEPRPQVGGLSVLVDGRGAPLAILQTTTVDVKPLIDVDDQFAWDEGEGDRTRDDWLRIHRNFFTAETNEAGIEFNDLSLTMFERFTVIWPPEFADSPADHVAPQADAT